MHWNITVLFLFGGMFWKIQTDLTEIIIDLVELLMIVLSGLVGGPSGGGGWISSRMWLLRRRGQSWLSRQAKLGRVQFTCWPPRPLWLTYPGSRVFPFAYAQLDHCKESVIRLFFLLIIPLPPLSLLSNKLSVLLRCFTYRDLWIQKSLRMFWRICLPECLRRLCHDMLMVAIGEVTSSAGLKVYLILV